MVKRSANGNSGDCVCICTWKQRLCIRTSVVAMKGKVIISIDLPGPLVVVRTGNTRMLRERKRSDFQPSLQSIWQIREFEGLIGPIRYAPVGSTAFDFDILGSWCETISPQTLQTVWTKVHMVCLVYRCSDYIVLKSFDCWKAT